MRDFVKFLCPFSENLNFKDSPMQRVKTSQDSAQALDLVPAEIWVEIFAYFNQNELFKSISFVCKNWFQITSKERTRLIIKTNRNSENIVLEADWDEVQSLVNRFPNLKELILKPEIFWITKESPILPLCFDENPYLVKVYVFGWYDFLSEDNYVYRLKHKTFVIKNTEISGIWMNPKENEICVGNIRSENVRHLKFTLHFEDWTTQNDFRQGRLYILTETLDHFLSVRT